MRATLLQLKSDEHVLIFNLHHIIADEWSLKVWYRELGTLYTGLVEGKRPRCQRCRFNTGIMPPGSADGSRATPSSSTSLTGEYEAAIRWPSSCPPIGRAPNGLPRRRPTYPIGLIRAGALEIGPARTRDDVDAVVAAFNVLLYRYTGQETSSSALLSRAAPARNSKTSSAFSSIPCRCVPDFPAQPTFRDLLGEFREVALGAYSHQDLPFDKLVEVLHPMRDMNHSPFFKVIFALQNAPMRSVCRA